MHLYTYYQGRRHEGSAGGGGLIPTGGRIQVSQDHLPLNSKFSSDFTHFILGILEKLKIFENITKIFF